MKTFSYTNTTGKLRKHKYILQAFPCDLAGKKFTCNVGDLDSIPVLGRFRDLGRLPTSVFWPREFHGLYRGLRHTLCAPGPRDPTETETELCLSVSCGGMGQQWTAAGARDLGVVDLGMA